MNKIKLGKKELCIGSVILVILLIICGFAVQKRWVVFAQQRAIEQKATDKETLLESYTYGSVFDTATKKSIYTNRNIMVFVPHEDDDILLMAGQLEEYMKYGSKVKVVFVTNGDRYDGAPERLPEAVNVLTSYGIPKENVIFLGYGDKWSTEYGHIYTAPGDEVVTSANDKQATYGVEDIQPYKQETYTKNHLLADFKELITDNKPDMLFCNDLDDHSDHRGTSLFFEEALGQVLRENPDYQPEVYKGFCYFEEWHGPDDFYADNLLSSHFDEKYMKDNQTYIWEERVRFPVSQESTTRVLEASRTYQAMAGYVSQDGASHAETIINGDKLFWNRRTDNAVLQADITVSSGDGSILNDFKIVDSTDVLNEKQFDKGIWIPEEQDQEKTATVIFKEPVDISQIVLYDNPSVADNIKEAVISFSDGTSVTSGALDVAGADSIISFDSKKEITEFSVTITQMDGSNAGLNEIEAYATPKQYNMQIVKLEDMDENFAYDYQTDEQGMATFQIYEYPQINGKYEVYLEHVTGGVVNIQDKAIGIYCPSGEKGTLVVYDPEKEEVVDAIWISNPF